MSAVGQRHMHLHPVTVESGKSQLYRIICVQLHGLYVLLSASWNCAENFSSLHSGNLSLLHTLIFLWFLQEVLHRYSFLSGSGIFNFVSDKICFKSLKKCVILESMTQILSCMSLIIEAFSLFELWQPVKALCVFFSSSFSHSASEKWNHPPCCERCLSRKEWGLSPDKFMPGDCFCSTFLLV